MTLQRSIIILIINNNLSYLYRPSMHVSAQKHFTNAKWNYPCLPVCLHYGFRKVQPEISVLTVDLNTCWEGLSLIVSGSSFHGWVVALAELKHNSFNISDQRDRPVFLVSLQWPITDFLMVADMFYVLTCSMEHTHYTCTCWNEGIRLVHLYHVIFQ